MSIVFDASGLETLMTEFVKAKKEERERKTKAGELFEMNAKKFEKS